MSSVKLFVVIFLLIATSEYSECENNDLNLGSFSLFYGIISAAENNLKYSACKEELVNMTRSIRDREIWALKLYDASGVPSTGLHWGHTYWLGSRHQCLSASRTDYKNLNPNPAISATLLSDIPPFSVNYFVAYLRHNSDFQISVYWTNETKISVGLCLPSSCNEDQISRCLQSYLNSDRFSYQHLYNTSLQVLEIKRTEEWFNWRDPVTTALIIILLIIGLLVISATLYDLQTSSSKSDIKLCDEKHEDMNIMRKETDDNIWFRILVSFSFSRNFQSIFNMTTDSAKFDSICGLRAYTTLFVIVSHSFLFLIDFYDNKVFAFDSVNTYMNQIFLNSSFSTDAFFCMSGFLMAYSFYKSKTIEKNDLFNLLMSYLDGICKRLVRLTPSYVVIMLFTIVLTSYNHSIDSLWINERNDIVCRQYWWTNMLYINNIFPGRNMCMYWTHYLALEMQFFVIVTFCFHLSKKYLKLAFVILLTIFIASIIGLGYTTYAMNYRSYSVNFYRYIEIFYYPPWMRIGSYIIGTMYGYLYVQMDKRLVLSKVNKSVIWITVLSIMTYLEFGFKDRGMSLTWSILHTSLSRYIWAACVGWIILACVTGNGGVLNDLLSAKIWIPISRLSYCAYLINPLISYTMGALSDKSLRFETFSTVVNASGLIMVTLFLSIPLACCVEIPSIKIYNIIVDKWSAEIMEKSNKTICSKIIRDVDQKTSKEGRINNNSTVKNHNEAKENKNYNSNK